MLTGFTVRPALVVGGGLSGLLLAMRLAQRGHPVQVFEKNVVFGGYNGRVDIGGDPLVCYKALGLEPDGGLFRNLVEQGVWQGPPPRRMEVCDHLLCEGESLPLPGSVEALQAWLRDRYPTQRRGLEQLFDTMRRCHEAIRIVSSVTSAGRRAQAYAYLSKVGQERFRERLGAAFDDPDLRRMLSLRAFSSANTTLTMAAYLARILIDGLYHVPGSGAALTDMIVDYLRGQPSAVLHAGTEVTELLFDADERAIGVRLADGRMHYGEVVINIDPLDVARRLTASPVAASRIARSGVDSVASLSALCVIFDIEAGLGRALARHASTARFVICDAVDLFDVLEAREQGALDLRACKVNFDSAADGVVERVYVELDCNAAAADFAATGEARAAALAPLVADVRQRLQRLQPDFADGITATRVLTPADFARVTGNRAGAASGFADSPGKPRQLDQALFDHGLTLVGQWSLFGSGLPQLEMSAGHAYRNLRSNALAQGGG